MSCSCKPCQCRVSSLAKKYLMALSGLVLAGFAFVHMIGNLQMFQSPEHINVYAHFLQNLPPPALWGFRAVMLAAVAVHAATGISLALENRAARGSEGYAVKETRAASFAAKTMPYSGLVLLAFVLFHILHYTMKAPASLGTGEFHATVVTDIHAKLFGVFDYPIFKGETVNDCYNMVVTGFSSPVISGFYIVAMLLLAFHLSHGIASIFQTFGLRNEKWRMPLNCIAALYGVTLFGGLAATPVGVLAGKCAPETKCPLAIQHKYAEMKEEVGGKTIKSPIFTPPCADCRKYHAAAVTPEFFKARRDALHDKHLREHPNHYRDLERDLDAYFESMPGSGNHSKAAQPAAPATPAPAAPATDATPVPAQPAAPAAK